MIALPDGEEIAYTYRIEAHLGTGAFGTVYRVHHRFLGRLALKVLPYETDSDLDQLATEGARHSRLAHPNITRVYDVNIAEVGGDRFLFIASEYMPMGNLGSYLDMAVRLEMNEWRTLSKHVLGALSYAHEQEPTVLHRDITLANILVGGTSSQRIFKLGDFGVSAELLGGSRVSSAAGTVRFLAPECGFGPYLRESDLYSAAVVFYRALTGTYPFASGPGQDDPGHYESKTTPLPPSRFFSECGQELDAVLLRGLAPDPFERFSSARAFLDAILASSKR